jgi:hypothetical protein
MNSLLQETATALRWHLKSNVYPLLNDNTIESIIRCCEQYSNGEIDMDSPVGNGQITFGEMLEDLKIDLSLFSNPKSK